MKKKLLAGLASGLLVFGIVATVSTTPINVALTGQATQSSTWYGAR